MTTSTIAPPAPPNPAIAVHFPQAAIEKCIRDELIEAVKADASIKGIALPSTAADIAKSSYPVDSLVVVSILCIADPIVGFELPDRVVRAGGYGSVNSALSHLLPRIKDLWIKRKGGKP